MKATQRIRRTAAWGLSALALSTVLLCSVACTKGNSNTPGDTTSGTPSVTTPGSSESGTTGGSQNSSGTDSDIPMSPDAGTVDPNGNAGDPPTGTDKGDDTRGFRSHFMH